MSSSILYSLHDLVPIIEKYDKTYYLSKDYLNNPEFGKGVMTIIGMVIHSIQYQKAKKKYEEGFRYTDKYFIEKIYASE